MATPLPADERFTVVGAAAAALIADAHARGIPTAPILAACGLSPASLADPDTRVPQGVYNRLFDALGGGADTFGLELALRTPPTGFSVVGALAQRSSTFGEALARIVRYSRIVHDAGRVEVDEVDDELHVHPGCRGLLHEMPRQIAEHAAASLVVQASAILGRALPVRSVAFRHPPPTDTSVHARIFGVVPTFGAKETVVVLPRATAQWPIPGADPALAALLTHYAGDLMARLQSETDTIARVEEVIARRLEDGPPSLEDTARVLGLSARTLQRRLADAETHYAEIVDSVRRQLAERYVATPDLSLHEIAFLVGFADPSNFHRAYRRWFGRSPRGAG